MHRNTTVDNQDTCDTFFIEVSPVVIQEIVKMFKTVSENEEVLSLKNTPPLWPPA